MTRPNACTSLNSQVFRAQGTTVLGAPFWNRHFLRCQSRSHLNGLHLYDPDTFRIVRPDLDTTSQRHSATETTKFLWLVG